MKKIKIECTGTENIALDDFTELQGNLKDLAPENYERLKKSIIKYGFSFPMFVWKNKGVNYIIDAHQRKKTLKALESEGYEIPALPTVFINAKDKKQAKEKLLQLNSNYGKITQDGFYEFLNEPGAELDLSDLDLSLPDFDMVEFEDKFLTPEDDSKDDEVPEVSENPVSKLGDLWLLGDHRVLCGDSTKKEEVERLMDGERADMVFTDPPYGINLDVDYLKTHKNNELGHKGKQHPIFKKVLGDDKEYDPSHINEFFPYCGEIFLWGADYYLDKIENTGGWFVWDKIVGRFEGRIGNDFEMCWSKKRHKKQIVSFLWVGHNGLEKQDTKSRIHPTQKPVELCVWFIDSFSKKDNIILDLFLGSGSTLIACEKTNRKCYGMELDTHYTDVIIKRWEDYTGKKAKHESGKTFEELSKERL